MGNGAMHLGLVNVFVYCVAYAALTECESFTKQCAYLVPVLGKHFGVQICQLSRIANTSDQLTIAPQVAFIFERAREGLELRDVWKHFAKV